MPYETLIGFVEHNLSKASSEIKALVFESNQKLNKPIERLENSSDIDGQIILKSFKIKSPFKYGYTRKKTLVIKDEENLAFDKDLKSLFFSRHAQFIRPIKIELVELKAAREKTAKKD